MSDSKTEIGSEAPTIRKPTKKSHQSCDVAEQVEERYYAFFTSSKAVKLKQKHAMRFLESRFKSPTKIAELKKQHTEWSEFDRKKKLERALKLIEEIAEGDLEAGNYFIHFASFVFLFLFFIHFNCLSSLFYRHSQEVC